MLNSIVIKSYHLQVSDIKRLNCLYNDRDFFALKTAKIPIKAHSILSQEGELDKRRQQKPKQISNESTNSTTEDDIGLRGVYHSDSCDADESSKWVVFYFDTHFTVCITIKLCT